MKKMILELKRILTEQSSSVKNTSEWKNALTSHEVFYIECIKTESNLVRALCYSILVFAVQISNIIGDKLTSAHPGFELGYLAGNLFLTLISVIYFFITLFILSEYRQGAKMKLKKTVYLSFWFFISLGSLFFCLLDLMERESLIN
ncbi:MAG: hypothetical protein Q8873_08270, partial [Bacillota bacterium]|nr:hypothetical protein [Bacillota bacterium]